MSSSLSVNRIPLPRAPWTTPSQESPAEALAHEHEIVERLAAEAGPVPAVAHDDLVRVGRTVDRSLLLTMRDGKLDRSGH